MKSLLAAANKSLIEIRQQNLDKNEEIVKQKELIATLTESKNKLEQSTKEIKDNFDNIVNSSQSEREALSIKINQLTIDLDNAKKENTDLQEEYQKYKNRANVIFQQYSENNIKMKIDELEELNTKLEEEKRNDKAKYEEISQRNLSIKDELSDAYEKISSLQNQIFEYEKDIQESNQIKAEIAILKTKIKENEDNHAKELENQKNSIDIEIQNMKKKFNNEIEKLQLINEQKSKNNDSLKSANDELNNKLTEKSKEIEQLKKDLQDKLQKLTQNNLSVDTNEVISSQPASSLNTLTAEQSSLSQLISPMTLARNTNTPVSLSVLLSSKDSNSTAITNNNDDNINNNINNNNNNNNKAYESTGTVEDSSSNREIELKKQVQNLMDLLNESERNVRELTKKESNLKEELDKMNRDEKRTTVNMEYLKNVVLRFLESNEKEKLVPVITNLLQLDSKEIERLQAISENKRKFW
jgi:FtsZ-binding cell division protein ZapB